MLSAALFAVFWGIARMELRNISMAVLFSMAAFGFTALRTRNSALRALAGSGLCSGIGVLLGFGADLQSSLGFLPLVVLTGSFALLGLAFWLARAGIGREWEKLGRWSH
ncbi:MAG TPA: hypothetical protein VFN90_00800 [Gemmatimonadales bacterium]|nr:hypothetical protein [Gemmatimonadales bacterium]